MNVHYFSVRVVIRIVKQRVQLLLIYIVHTTDLKLIRWKITRFMVYKDES